MDTTKNSKLLFNKLKHNFVIFNFVTFFILKN